MPSKVVVFFNGSQSRQLTGPNFSCTEFVKILTGTVLFIFFLTEICLTSCHMKSLLINVFQIYFLIGQNVLNFFTIELRKFRNLYKILQFI
jgi:hypothetical protein